ncbi:MAG: type II toxin-antitoxin system PemK/MazF family toxin [Magnetococcales bacterium]|nr:type II toxin-antitoxin system PemK/MazF family toxin [Magnetococcales bacterium]
MTYKPGTLVVVPFPFADLSFKKKRPVLVLTFPDRYGDFIGLDITSVPTQESAMHLEPSDLISGALPLPSWVRLDKVYTLGVESITRGLAEVRPDVLVRIIRGTCEIVGLASTLTPS